MGFNSGFKGLMTLFFAMQRIVHVFKMAGRVSILRCGPICLFILIRLRGEYFQPITEIREGTNVPSLNVCLYIHFPLNRSRKLTFKNRASYIQDGRTATLQMLHFIYFFPTTISTEYFKHAAHSPFFSSKCRLFHNATFFSFMYYSHFTYRVC